MLFEGQAPDGWHRLQIARGLGLFVPMRPLPFGTNPLDVLAKNDPQRFSPAGQRLRHTRPTGASRWPHERWRRHCPGRLEEARNVGGLASAR